MSTSRVRGSRRPRDDAQRVLVVAVSASRGIEQMWRDRVPRRGVEAELHAAAWWDVWNLLRWHARWCPDDPGMVLRQTHAAVTVRQSMIGLDPDPYRGVLLMLDKWIAAVGGVSPDPG